jgi:hypothetical protein
MPICAYYSLFSCSNYSKYCHIDLLLTAIYIFNEMLLE